jgi:hypothetical protein
MQKGENCGYSGVGRRRRLVISLVPFACPLITGEETNGFYLVCHPTPMSRHVSERSTSIISISGILSRTEMKLFS